MQTVRYPGLGDPVAARYVSAFGMLLSFDVADAEQALAVERGAAADRERHEPRRASPRRSRPAAPLARGTASRRAAAAQRGLEDVEDLWADLAQALDALR